MRSDDARRAACWILVCGILSCGPREPGRIAEGALAAGPIVSTAASNDATTVTYTLNYTGTHTFFRVYVDTDQSAGTGFATRGVGADFLVENGNLYRYAGGGTDWAWTQVRSVAFSNAGGVAEWQVARADIGETAVCGERSNLLFDIDDTGAPVLTQVFTPAGSCGGGGPAAPIANTAASNDATTVSYAFDYAGTPSFFRVYIDADQNAATGFAAGPGVGADFLLENAGLWTHTGSGWSWSSDGAVTFAASNQHASWTVARARIGETRLCGEASTLLFQTQDSAIHSTGAVAQAFTDDPSCAGAPAPAPAHLPYVFVIAMENEPAAAIYGSASAPYINGTLLPRYARADAFADPLPDALPSEPHYVWMEAGTNAFADVTFTTDDDPSASNSTRSTAHLVTQMGAASPAVGWRSYQQSMSAATGACPVVSAGLYAAKHNPFVFFQDVAGSPPSPSNAFCAAHHRAFSTTTLAADLAAGDVAPYTFITPDGCNDMHDNTGCVVSDPILRGDMFLQANMPLLINFVNANGGVIFIVWDEPIGGSTLIPFLAVGPGVKPGYAGQVAYNHGSLTRTVEEVFGLPILPTVAGVNDLGDLFQPGAFP
jgi:hypothetical protein